MQLMLIAFFALLFFIFLFLGLTSENGSVLVIFAAILAFVLCAIFWTTPVEYKVGENATVYGNTTITTNTYEQVSNSYTKPLSTAFIILGLSLVYIVVTKE